MIVRARERELEERELNKMLLRAVRERDLAEIRGRRWVDTLCRVDERITLMLGHIARDINQKNAKAIHYRFLTDLIRIKRLMSQNKTNG